MYAGVHIDYSGNDVNADVFLAVLEGNKSAVAGIGSGKVRRIEVATQARCPVDGPEERRVRGLLLLCGCCGQVIASGPNDHVFLFYSDHGSPGVLGMPTGAGGARLVKGEWDTHGWPASPRHLATRAALPKCPQATFCSPTT